MRRHTRGTLRGALLVVLPVLLLAAAPLWSAEPAQGPSLATLDSAQLKLPQAAALTQQLRAAAKADQDRAKATKADLEQRAATLAGELSKPGASKTLRAALSREQAAVKAQLSSIDSALQRAAQRRQEAAAAQLRDLIRSAVSTVAPGALVLDRAAAAGVVWQMPEGVRDITADVQRELDRAGKGPAK